MEPRTRERITVLVVDDHRAVAEAIQGAISSEGGLDVSATWSGEEALEIVQRDPPHVILMDVAMPGMAASRRRGASWRPIPRSRSSCYPPTTTTC